MYLEDVMDILQQSVQF